MLTWIYEVADKKEVAAPDYAHDAHTNEGGNIPNHVQVRLYTWGTQQVLESLCHYSIKAEGNRECFLHCTPEISSTGGLRMPDVNL